MFSGCSLLGVNQWSAYKVTVDVHNQSGVAVENTKLVSNNVESKTTNKEGRADLKFPVAGLHVVTITAEGKVTKQIKISLPQDDNKIIHVILKDKQ